MASPTHVIKNGNAFRVVMDDGSEYRAIPIQPSVWGIAGFSVDPPVDPPDPGDGEFRFPFPRARINFTSYYGHSGIDYPGSSVGSSAAVKAIGPGTVVARHVNSVNDPDNFAEPTWRGNSVTIDHGVIGGIGITSIYAHMRNAPLVAMGASVVGGQQLGNVGNSGASQGAHLHLEVVYNGDRLETSTPGNNTPGLGFQRTLAWLDANAAGSW